MIKFALVIVAVSLLAACAAEDRGVVRAGPADPFSGRTFVSTGVTEGGTDRPLVDGTRIELRFAGDRTLGVRAGCNQMSGPVTIEGDTLRVGDLTTTDMGCDQPRMDQDSWFAGVLKAAPAWRLDGDTLTLTTERTEIRFTMKTSPPLVGTRWNVTGLVDGDTVASLPPDVEAYLEFDGTRVTGNAGCNRISGPATPGPDAIEFGPIVATKMACGGGRDTTERAVLRVLGAGTVRMVLDDTLRLTGADGTGITLRSA
ncbi:META domain-containing protein [Cryptosporangium arvum]|uniref:Heat shock protein n=1 Tax=Cryptosporangium arvum DSM 44712 TaxID=927661 RepID=A0A010ZV27_9ACTN|nr:META domain-containing protein [Cryptosporangium arvum]EXG81062.1 heat shock protein [Cryptosporangium arvum DSM 44712]